MPVHLRMKRGRLVTVSGLLLVRRIIDLLSNRLLYGWVKNSLKRKHHNRQNNSSAESSMMVKVTKDGTQEADTYNS